MTSPSYPRPLRRVLKGSGASESRRGPGDEERCKAKLSAKKPFCRNHRPEAAPSSPVPSAAGTEGRSVAAEDASAMRLDAISISSKRPPTHPRDGASASSSTTGGTSTSMSPLAPKDTSSRRETARAFALRLPLVEASTRAQSSGTP